MARKDEENTEATEAEAPAVEIAPSDEIPMAAVPKRSRRKGSGQGRIKITHTESGKVFRRTEVILKLWETKQFDRNQIVQVLERDYGHTTNYQTVFSTTKGVEGGPDKPEKEEGEDTPADETAEA